MYICVYIGIVIFPLILLALYQCTKMYRFVNVHIEPDWHSPWMCWQLKELAKKQVANKKVMMLAQSSAMARAWHSTVMNSDYGEKNNNPFISDPTHENYPPGTYTWTSPSRFWTCADGKCADTLREEYRLVSCCVV
jgi:hypothetical protein